MEPNRFATASTSTTREIDAGLRKHMNNIYARMSGGVLVTALVALVVGTSPALLNLFLGGPQRYLVIFAPLAIIWFGFRPDRMKASQLMAAFFGVAVVYGISFAAIAAVATNNPAFAVSVAKAFFIATAMFAGLSIVGYTTKKDLSGLQTFLSMGIIGLVVFGIMNIFFQSSMLSNLIAGAGILLFSGLTVWQTQDMKRMYSANMPAEFASRMGWAAALNLYISFIAMFQYILHFMNQR
ncbi:MAG TPA: Bax inhibitor-1/YccA family protein [Alphaproteobacteria bacterium]|nr:Bax inhibitor-1/YccA family protein [Alphaproteobacteria bacterium]